MKRALFILMFWVLPVSAQTTFSHAIKGVRIYGRAEEDLPVFMKNGHPVTLEFDIDSDDPPALQLRLHHCDRNWRRTETSFVNDEFRNKTRSELPFVTAPMGVRGYGFHYSILVPDESLVSSLSYSGNYVVEVWDRENERKLASARFFVVEPLIHPNLRITNRLDPERNSPFNQVHQLVVTFSLPGPDSSMIIPFSSYDFSSVDVYKNREVHRSWRIDANDVDPNTFVGGLPTTTLEFRIDNIQPGNEYRGIGLENVDFYPQDRLVRAKAGADLSRFPGMEGSDHNGGSSLVRGTRYAEYLNFRFELLWDTPSDSVFVVGDFNGWSPEQGGPMHREKDRYTWTTSLRRGSYDYQYVVGRDWIVLEGNDWRTVNRYTAFVYYRDPRFGGFDRILGVAQGLSPGGNSPTSH